MPRGRKATPAPEAEQAVLGIAAAEIDPVSAVIERGSVIKSARRIQRWRIDALIPNMHNAALFPDSLSDAQIALLAEDIEKYGQNVPITITPSSKIVDGERRWRAAKSLGLEHLDVIVGEELTDAQILDRVVDSCVSARQMTVREQTNIYVAVVEQLKRTAGRAQGRPKTKPNGDLLLSANQIQEVAAAKARFDSARSAERARAVFARAPDEVQDQVSRGELSIAAGYKLVPKREREPKTGEEKAESDVPTEQGRGLCTGSGEQGKQQMAAAPECDVKENPFHGLSEDPPNSQLLASPEKVRVAGEADVDASTRSSDDQMICDEPLAKTGHEEKDEKNKPSGDAGGGHRGSTKPRQARRQAGREAVIQADTEHTTSPHPKQGAEEGEKQWSIDNALDYLYVHLERLKDADAPTAKRFAAGVVKRMREVLELGA